MEKKGDRLHRRATCWAKAVEVTKGSNVALAWSKEHCHRDSN